MRLHNYPRQYNTVIKGKLKEIYINNMRVQERLRSRWNNDETSEAYKCYSFRKIHFPRLATFRNNRFNCNQKHAMRTGKLSYGYMYLLPRALHRADNVRRCFTGAPRPLGKLIIARRVMIHYADSNGGPD